MECTISSSFKNIQRLKFRKNNLVLLAYKCDPLKEIVMAAHSLSDFMKAGMRGLCL